MVVTGVSGLLGANFACSARSNWRVAGFYRHHPVKIPNVNTLSCDLLQASEITSHLKVLRPSVIVHLAAATDVEWCETNPSQTDRINRETTKVLAQWAAEHECKFVFMSTDAVFDGAEGGYTETDPVGPTNRYAESKLRGENAVRDASPFHLIIRGNIYGWNLQSKLSLGEWILNQAQAGEGFPGFTDVIFAPLLVNTLAEVMLRMLEVEATGTFHVACRIPCNKFDFAQRVVKTFGLDPGLVKPSISSYMTRRPLNTWLRADKLRSECGIFPPCLEEDLLRFKGLRDSGNVALLKSMNVS